MDKSQLPWLAIASALFACVSTIAAIVSFRVHRMSLAAKFMDRLYELDKLILANSGTYKTFVGATSWDKIRGLTGCYVTESEHFKVKAFAYFYINLFDEIYTAYGYPYKDLDAGSTWKAWRHFILQRVRHPLLSALIERECTSLNGRLRKNDVSVLNPRLLDFLCNSQAEWYQLTPNLDDF